MGLYVSEVAKKFLAIFIVTHILGVYIGLDLISQNVSAFEDKESIGNATYLFGNVLIATSVFLLVLAVYKGVWIFKILESIVVFITSLLVFPIIIMDISNLFIPGYSVLLGDIVGLAASVFLVVARIVWSNIALRNLAAMVSVSGAGAMFGASLGLVPALAFAALLTVYDYIAVFKTKHMVVMAKAITGKNLSLTLAIPTREHVFQVGTGDLLIPTIISVSCLNGYLPYLPFSMIGSIFGFLLLFYISKKMPGIALPALPPVVGVTSLFIVVGTLFA